MRYGYNLGCRFGQPHDLKTIHENPQVKWEVCQLCNKKFKFNKGYKGRVNNVEYLKAHIRNFAQSWGATKRVYQRVYHPENMVIKL